MPSLSGKRFRMFVLGAGFSKPAGFPLGLDLWHEVRRRVRLLDACAKRFDSDLDSYLHYKEDCFERALDTVRKPYRLLSSAYSLPTQDEYARQVLHAIVTNYQQEHWDEDFQGLTKQPLVIVDYCRDAEALAAFKARYRFVNWDRAILCPDGLNEDTVRRALGRQVA